MREKVDDIRRINWCYFNDYPTVKPIYICICSLVDRADFPSEANDTQGSYMW